MSFLKWWGSKSWIAYVATFAVVVLLPWGFMLWAVMAIDPHSPGFLAGCDLGATSFLTATAGLTLGAICLLLVYAVIAWFIVSHRRRMRVGAIAQLGDVLLASTAALFAVLCALGFAVSWMYTTTAFCI